MKWILLLISFSSLFGVERRSVREPMKISVIIPCAGQHFQFLSPLLIAFQTQTSPPDEIVISLSSIEHLEKEEVDALEQKRWPFHVKIIRSVGKQSPGLNRNIAANQTTGDVIVSQDADDLPHPQRIEIVKFIFENYVVDHLLHKWIPEGEPFVLHQLDQIELTRFEHLDDLFASPFGDHLHNGNNAISRDVMNQIKWIDVKDLTGDRDVQFNHDVYAKFKNTAVIPHGLIVYRWNYSALLSNPSWP